MPAKYAVEEWCEAYLDIFCDEEDLYFEADAEAMNEEYFLHFRKGDIFESARIIGNWTESYMDNLELLHGSGETDTMMGSGEMTLEFIRCFQENLEQLEQHVIDYCQCYLQLYSPAEILVMNVEEMNEEIFRIFRNADSLDQAILVENWSDIYMEVFEHLYGDVGIISAMNVEEMNRFFIRSFRKDEEAEFLLKSAA
jgi:hypothetical protein